MSGIIENGTSTAITAAKLTLSPLLNYLQGASTMTGKAWFVAASAAKDTTTSALNYIVQMDSTGLVRIGISRLEAGDKALWIALGVTAFASYTLLCNSLRFRRRDDMVKKYGYYDRASMANMTTTEAQEIIKTLTELEWPTVFVTSVEFALFKVGLHLSLPVLATYVLTLTPDVRYSHHLGTPQCYEGRQCQLRVTSSRNG